MLLETVVREIDPAKAEVLPSVCPICAKLVEHCDHSPAERAQAPRRPRPDLCRKRGCYVFPKEIFPGWSALEIRCATCPYTGVAAAPAMSKFRQGKVKAEAGTLLKGRKP
jgi:hypothetical protein